MDVLILHGIQNKAGAHWQQWLNDNLTDIGHRVAMPQLPEADRPDRGEWLEAAESAIASFDRQQLIVIGHSLGVVTGLDLADKSPTPFAGLVAVSGFGRDYGSELNSYFMQARELDLNNVIQNMGRAHVLYGDDDPYVTQSALRELATDLNIDPVIISGGGHLNTETGFTTFPILLTLLASITPRAP